MYPPLLTELNIPSSVYFPEVDLESTSWYSSQFDKYTAPACQGTSTMRPPQEVWSVTTYQVLPFLSWTEYFLSCRSTLYLADGTTRKKRSSTSRTILHIVRSDVFAKALTYVDWRWPACSIYMYISVPISTAWHSQAGAAQVLSQSDILFPSSAERRSGDNTLTHNVFIPKRKLSNFLLTINKASTRSSSFLSKWKSLVSENICQKHLFFSVVDRQP